MNVFIYQPETDTLTEIIDDTTAMVGKNNLQHLFLPTRNWYMCWHNIRRYRCIIVFIGMIFATVHRRGFPYVQGNPQYYPGISHQLRYTQHNSDFTTHTHTPHRGFHFHLFLIFVSENRSLVISTIWNIWISHKNLPQKRKVNP